MDPGEFAKDDLFSTLSSSKLGQIYDEKSVVSFF